MLCVTQCSATYKVRRHGRGQPGCSDTGNYGTVITVSEPVCFRVAPAPGIFYPEPAPGEREHNVGIFFKLTTNCLKYVLIHVPVHIGHNLCSLYKRHQIRSSSM